MSTVEQMVHVHEEMTDSSVDSEKKLVIQAYSSTRINPLFKSIPDINRARELIRNETF